MSAFESPDVAWCCMALQVVKNRRPQLPPPLKVGMATPENPPSDLDLATLPASTTSLHQFNDIIRQCWQQRELKRPTATAVFTTLVGLLQQHGVEIPHDLRKQVWTAPAS